MDLPGGEIVNNGVRQSRFPYTTTTSVWGNGDCGPLVFVFKQDSYSRKVAQKLNAEYRDQIHIIYSGSDESHFMNGESTVRMWESCYGGLFARRRAQLGLTLQDRGALIFDQFTGNAAAATDLQRDLFLQTHNLRAVALPPKSSAVSQPCDGLHAYWRRLTDAYEEVMMGNAHNPLLRKRVEAIAQNAIGVAPLDYTSVDHVVLSGLWAWQNMPGPLRRWSWTSRGLVPHEAMAAMHQMTLEDIVDTDPKAVERLRKHYIVLENPPDAKPTAPEVGAD